MNILDIILLVFAIAYALSGYRQGFIVGACATAGLLIGGALGVWVAPMVLEGYDPSLTVSLAALAGVLLCATIGQAIAALAGGALRRRVTWRPARALDAVGGAVLSASAALVVAWALGVAVSSAQIPAINREVSTSRVLSAVDRVLPGNADSVLDALNSVVDQSIFPSYLDPFVPERIVSVDPPTRRVLRDAQVRRTAPSVVKILGTAESCARSSEGTGFVYAPGKVMTNAHVVAGVDEPEVITQDETLSAEVVVYDPDLDVAVLDVEGLDERPLRFARDGETGDAAAVLGYPGNGPFHGEPARIRSEQRLRSSDIYGEGVVHREVFSLFAKVRPGNSGGPLVSPRGRVYGVIFAASVSDPQTGYALTADQVARNARLGRQAERAVDTGPCSS
ncbi:MAG: MarP family serine protease [Actinomycetota bacterium]|nr:MarP family serine protease [Actinomycetota bacterium]